MADAVLRTADATEKTALSLDHAARWAASRAAGAPLEIGHATPPDRPSRPERPELLDPRDVPRRRPGSEKGRIAILHAVGSSPPRKNRAISSSSATRSTPMAATTAPCPPMPGCGVRRKTPRMT